MTRQPTPTVEPTPHYVQGRTLAMRAETPIIQDAVHYVGLDTTGKQHNWAIDPVNSGTKIAVVEVTIINATSGSVHLVVDRDAAELWLRDVSEGVKPVNVIDRAIPTDSYNPGLNFAGFIPIWGSLTLNSNEQIHGYMVFEVPEGATPREFRSPTSCPSVTSSLRVTCKRKYYGILRAIRGRRPIRFASPPTGWASESPPDVPFYSSVRRVPRLFSLFWLGLPDRPKSARLRVHREIAIRGLPRASFPLSIHRCSLHATSSQVRGVGQTE